MRIISRFHDYYDSALAYGMDPAIVYRRECSERRVPEAWNSVIDELLPLPRSIIDVYYQPQKQIGIVVVGNQARRIWLTERPSLEALSTTTAKRIVFDNREAREHLIAEAREIFGRSIKELEDELDEYIAKINEPPNVPSSWMVELDAPVYMISWGFGREEKSHRAILNPRLASLGMEKLIDPFTAMQEITMVLGQRLALEDKAPPTVGDDGVIAQSKGFDDQSFRTAAPGHKKENRKANRLRKKNGANETDPA